MALDICGSAVRREKRKEDPVFPNPGKLKKSFKAVI
jgi:hypothetical protein